MPTVLSRAARYATVADTLSQRSDAELAALVGSARPAGAGIGGATAMLEVAGVPVFVKRVALTDTERANRFSTANLFDLPPYYQYGIGSAGFGAWRELAAHTMTTNWVLSGDCDSFPLMYHWRELPAADRPAIDIDGTVRYWGGSSAIRRRLDEIVAASASLVLFLEYVPQNLDQWLGARVDRLDAVAPVVENRLAAVTEFLAANGLTHFDAHFRNILADDDRLYLTDFGLATAPSFALSDAEAEFLRRHPGFDRVYVMGALANWLARNAPNGQETDALLRTADRATPPAVAAIIARYAPAALAMNRFFEALVRGSKTIRYPAAEIAVRTGTAGGRGR